MKLIGVVSTAVLSLALGVAVPAFAQEQRDQDEKSKPAAQEEKKAQPEKSAKQEEKPSTRQEQAAKPEERNAKQEDKNVKSAERPAEKNEQQRAGNNGGGRIPADRYQANFGRQHTFHVSQGDYRNHRFQYGGYWFGFADAWPSNWLYTQDVYVIDINGVYYLCNPMYPGVNITLSFTL
ncbi:MAG TPA: hypothetical protein VK828_18930 [Terriglobales bacterium]|jgi:hypothetical protein|nr:hypothetical protein [Terriglobales bacterium]